MNTFSPDDVVWIGKCDLPCEDHYGRVERQIDTYHCGVWVPMHTGGTPRYFIVHIFAMLKVGRHEAYQEQKAKRDDPELPPDLPQDQWPRPQQ